jgi:hypothetical protein
LGKIGGSQCGAANLGIKPDLTSPILRFTEIFLENPPRHGNRPSVIPGAVRLHANKYPHCSFFMLHLKSSSARFSSVIFSESQMFT